MLDFAGDGRIIAWLMRRRNSILPIVLLGCAARAFAGGEIFAISSNPVVYPEVIQGAQETIDAQVFNLGTGTGSYAVSAICGSNQVNLGSLTGTLLPNANSNNNFSVNTVALTPGTYPVSATVQDTTPGNTNPNTTVNSQFSVLAHAAPALYLQGAMVPLAAPVPPPVEFTTPEVDPNALGQSPPAGSEAAASFAPQMIGDPPPDVPTAELDLDSITASGSPYITTTLQPFTDLPSDDDPAEGLPFQVDAFLPALGDYSTTFTLYYSDEQDLPGADAPGSETASFTVEVDMTASTADWTVTVIPEPAALGLMIVVGIGALLRRSRSSRALPP